MNTFKDVNGIITLVQEHRFRLEEDMGRHRLFILTHDAALEWSDLHDMALRGCRVSVRYTDNDKLIAASAHAVTYL